MYLLCTIQKFELEISTLVFVTESQLLEKKVHTQNNWNVCRGDSQPLLTGALHSLMHHHGLEAEPGK